MSKRQELQAQLKAYRLNNNYQVNCSLTASTAILQQECDRIQTLYGIEQETEERITEASAEFDQVGEMSTEDNPATPQWEDGINEETIDPDAIEQVHTRPFYATISDYTMGVVREFFDPTNYYLRYEFKPLNEMYRLLVTENASIPPTDIESKSAMFSNLFYVESLVEMNTEVDKFCQTLFINLLNHQQNTNRIRGGTFTYTLAGYFSQLARMRTAFNYEIPLTDVEQEKVFYEMVSMSILRSLSTQNDQLSDQPRNLTYWKPYLQEKFTEILKAVKTCYNEQLGVYTNINNWREFVSYVFTNGLRKPVEADAITHDMFTPLICNTMETPFHVWTTDNLLSYAGIVGIDTSGLFHVSDFVQERQKLLSLIIAHESLTF